MDPEREKRPELIDAICGRVACISYDERLLVLVILIQAF